MAYIQRNAAGNIVAVFDDKQANAQEYLAEDKPELVEYLAHSASGTDDDAKAMLATSDLQLIRVLEDLIYTLIDKKVILFTDLPQAAQKKLVNRDSLREHVTDLDNLVDDNVGLL
ncbi:MAG: hypothetical protein COA95_00980 [Methylophaga sp.]|nr:MAG: hypothetical protein COA95_00980 [Methylophaga sp.]